MPPHRNRSSLSTQWANSTIKLTKISYVWTISNFSLRPETINQKLVSSEFNSEISGKDKWCLELYPRGNSGTSENVALYLKLLSSEKSEIFLHCKLFIPSSKKNIKSIEAKFTRKFKPGMTYGYPHLISRTALLSSNDFLIDDSLIICCELEIPNETVTTSSGDLQTSSRLKCPKAQLTKDLKSLLENPKFSDVMIVSGDTKFHAHKVILSARSSMFDNMIKNFDKNQHSVINIDNIKPEAVKNMLEYIYTDSVSDLDKLVNELIAASDRYGLSGLKQMCEELILQKLDEESAIESLVLADLYHAQELKKQILDFIIHHLPSVVNSIGYQTLEQMQPALLGEIIRAQVAVFEKQNEEPTTSNNTEKTGNAPNV